MSKDRLEITNWMLAVVNERPAAARATVGLLNAGFARDAVLLLQGPQAAARLQGSGSRGGPFTGLARKLSRTQAGQSADVATYQAALRAGREVVAVHIQERGEQVRAAEILAGAGAHFVNFFSRLGTEAVAPWRGEELPVR